MPPRRRESCSGRSSIAAWSDCGHANVPRSSLFAQTQSPLPSKNRTLRRLRRRLQKTNSCPLSGSFSISFSTIAASPLKDLRMSVAPATRKMFAPGATLSTFPARSRQQGDGAGPLPQIRQGFVAIDRQRKSDRNRKRSRNSSHRGPTRPEPESLPDACSSFPAACAFSRPPLPGRLSNESLVSSRSTSAARSSSCDRTLTD